MVMMSRAKLTVEHFQNLPGSVTGHSGNSTMAQQSGNYIFVQSLGSNAVIGVVRRILSELNMCVYFIAQ